MAPGNKCDHSRTTNKKKEAESDKPLADFPEWLEEFKENLVDTELFGDLITADHKVLNDGCASRNNHQYAVVVQDLTT